MQDDPHTLSLVGNTLRHPWNVLHAALVVGNTLTCHYWLNILPLARDARPDGSG